jgi:manganese transport protein
MGAWVNRWTTTLAGSLVAALIIGLNGYLLVGMVLG